MLIMFFVTFFGLSSVLLNSLPIESLQPVLLFLGLTMASEASYPATNGALAERCEPTPPE